MLFPNWPSSAGGLLTTGCDPVGAAAYLSLRVLWRALIRTRHRGRPWHRDEADVTEPSYELERPVPAGP